MASNLGSLPQVPSLISRGAPATCLRDRSVLRGSASASCLLTTSQAQQRSRAAEQHLSASGQLYQVPFEEAYQQVAKQRNLQKLEELFAEADEDGSNAMSLSEFRRALRKPGIQRTFSTLGVQPHQSELIFMSMAKNEDDELSFQQFLTGLQSVVGTDVDGTGTEVDISMLRPTRAARLQREGMRSAVSQSLASFSSSPLHSPLSSLPQARMHRSFIDTAQAKALLPPSASKQAQRSLLQAKAKARRPASGGR